jgi:hypothetical protein
VIFKVNLSDFSYKANITFSTGQNGAAAAALDPVRHIAYFGTYSGQIVKIDLTTFQEMASLSPGLGSVASAAIDPQGGFAYFGTSSTPGNIIKIRLSDFSINQTLNLGRLGGASSAVIDPANGYGYFGTSGCGLGIFTPSPPTVIVKVRLSDLNLNKTEQLTIPATEKCIFSADIDPTGGFAYFIENGYSGNALIRIRLSDFSLAGPLSPGPANMVSSVVLDLARGVAYVGEGSAGFSTIRLSDYNQIGFVSAYSQSLRLLNQLAAALDETTGYAYFTASTFGNNFRTTGVIVRLSPASLPTNDFSLNPSPSTISFQEGSVGAAYIFADSNNYTGTISLTATVGSSYALNPTTTILTPSVDLIRNGENSSILAISAAIQDDIPTSTFVVTVTGTSGGMSREVSLYVTINRPPLPYELYVSPESFGFHPGSTYFPTVSIAIQTHNPNPFTGTINLTASINPLLPNGPQISVNPSTVNVPANWVAGYTGISWVFISTNSSTATGQYEIDVRANSVGVSQTAAFCLLIVSGGTSKFCVLSNPNRLAIGPGQSTTSTLTLYKTSGLINNTYLGKVNLSASVASGPSVNEITTTLSSAVFDLPYALPGPQKLESVLSATASPNALPGDYMIRITATNGTLAGSVDIPLTVETSPVQGIPGLLYGDWARYQISAALKSTSPSFPPIPGVSEYLNAYGASLRVAATIGNETAGLLSTGYINGTERVQSINGNTISESGSLFPWIIGSSITFNTTASRVFAGASRLATILDLTANNLGITATGSWTWDYKTGVLLDYRLTVQGTGPYGAVDASVHVSMIDTNLWKPTLPYFTLRPSTRFLTINEFTSTDTKITLNSTGSFSGPVTLTAQPLPSNPSLSLSINNSVILQSNRASNVTLTINSSTLGRFIILVNATDGAEFQFVLLGITVVHVAPITLAISVGPNPAMTGQTVTLSYRITSITTVTTLPRITIDWGDGTITTPDPSSTSDSHVYTFTQFSQSHTYTINVTATNSFGSASATTNETVNDRPPLLAITGLSSPAHPGQLVRLNFTATDPDGTVTATWVDWGDGSKPDLIFQETSSSMCPPLNPGLGIIGFCTIWPGELIFAQSQDPSTIVNGSIIVFRPYLSAPDYFVVHRVIKIIPPTGSQYNEYTFLTQGDANPLPDAWTLTASQIVAVYDYTLTPVTIPGGRYDTHSYPNLDKSLSQTYTIRLNATDDSGSHSYLTTTETINDLLPTAKIDSISDNQIAIGGTVHLTFSTSDSDGSVSSIRIDWGDGTIISLPGSATTSAHTYDSRGTFTISVSATDNSGSTSQPATSTVRVILLPPYNVSTILGLAPALFYGAIGAIIVAIALIASTLLKMRKKT